jgi:hypothetical protein
MHTQAQAKVPNGKPQCTYVLDQLDQPNKTLLLSSTVLLLQNVTPSDQVCTTNTSSKLSTQGQTPHSPRQATKTNKIIKRNIKQTQKIASWQLLLVVMLRQRATDEPYPTTSDKNVPYFRTPPNPHNREHGNICSLTSNILL